MIMDFFKAVVIIVAGCMFPWSVVLADCNIDPDVPTGIGVRVVECSVVDPHKVPRLVEFADIYPKGFPEKNQENARAEVREVLDSYRGALIRVEYDHGHKEKLFFPSKEIDSCKQFPKGRAMSIVVEQACCDGDPNPPCFLGIRDYILNAK
jgi:hypothetical protein